MKVFLIVMVRLLYYHLPQSCTSVVEHYSGTKTCKLNELKVFQFKFSTKFILTWSTQLVMGQIHYSM